MNELNACEAAMSGQAMRVPAALKADNAVLRATIQVTRAATGLTETYEITGTPLPDDEKEAK